MPSARCKNSRQSITVHNPIPQKSRTENHMIFSQKCFTELDGPANGGVKCRNRPEEIKSLRKEPRHFEHPPPGDQADELPAHSHMTTINGQWISFGPMERNSSSSTRTTSRTSSQRRGKIPSGPKRQSESETNEELAAPSTDAATLARPVRQLFTSGRLITDCPLFIIKPRKDDDAKEFRKAFQVVVAKGLVWFRCRRAHFCGRKRLP